MKMQRIKIDPTTRAGLPAGRVDKRRLDETTEEDIARHQKVDDAESSRDAQFRGHRTQCDAHDDD